MTYLKIPQDTHPEMIPEDISWRYSTLNVGDFACGFEVRTEQKGEKR